MLGPLYITLPYVHVIHLFSSAQDSICIQLLEENRAQGGNRQEQCGFSATLPWKKISLTRGNAWFHISTPDSMISACNKDVCVYTQVSTTQSYIIKHNH